MTKNIDSADVVEIICNVVCLDELSNEIDQRVDFIKCDVEGAELFAFQGAKATISRQQPVIFTEMLRKWCRKFNYHPNEIIDFFESLGYECFAVDDGLRKCNRILESTTATNFIFFHRKKHAALVTNLRTLAYASGRVKDTG